MPHFFSQGSYGLGSNNSITWEELREVSIGALVAYKRKKKGFYKSPYKDLMVKEELGSLQMTPNLGQDSEGGEIMAF